MTLITFEDGKAVMHDGKVGTEQECCCPGEGGGPWCVSIAWDLEYDDVNDGLPPATIQGSAVVWVNEDGNAVDYAKRKCLDGVDADDDPFTDAGCTGTVVQDFCDGGFVNYGGISDIAGLDFTFEFSESGSGDVFVLNSLGVSGGTLQEGVNNVNESFGNNARTLTGTVTFSVEENVAEEDCGCP